MVAQTDGIYGSTQPNPVIDTLNSVWGIVDKGVGTWSDFMNAKTAAKIAEAQAKVTLTQSQTPNLGDQTYNTAGKFNYGPLVIGAAGAGIILLAMFAVKRI